MGVCIGVLTGSSRLACESAYPPLFGIWSIPIIVTVANLVLWFSHGVVPAVLIAAILRVFPVIVNVAMGISTVDPELEEVMKSLMASRLDILTSVSLPRSMPRRCAMCWDRAVG